MAEATQLIASFGVDTATAIRLAAKVSAENAAILSRYGVGTTRTQRAVERSAHCRYCGTRRDAGKRNCVNCGAPL